MQSIDRPSMFDSRWRIVRYLVAGAFNTGFGLAMIAFFMYGLSCAPELANALAYGIGIVTSFLLNKWFTFRSQGSSLLEAPRFLVSYGMAFLVNLLVLSLLVRIMGAHEFFAQLVASATFVMTSYVLQARMVFHSTGHR